VARRVEEFLKINLNPVRVKSPEDIEGRRFYTDSYKFICIPNNNL